VCHIFKQIGDFINVTNFLKNSSYIHEIHQSLNGEKKGAFVMLKGTRSSLLCASTTSLQIAKLKLKIKKMK
jgi:hypothetical protein